MKLSEIFRRAAENLPTECCRGMCTQIAQEIEIEDDRKFRGLFRRAIKILNKFKPGRMPIGSYWVTPRCIGPIYKNTIVLPTTKEAQAWRKDVLLKCAAIAESEGI